MRSSGTDFREAVQAAFGTEVVAVRPTSQDGIEFNGFYIPSNKNTVYVNTATLIRSAILKVIK